MSKGWDRPSIEMNTRPIRVERDIRREDLLVPAHEGLVLLATGCLGCGVIIAVLYVLFPLLLLSYAGLGLGSWLMGLVLAAAVVSAALLFAGEIRFRRGLVDEL